MAILARGQITIYIAEKGETGDSGLDLGGGKMLHRDPEFRSGVNGCSVYNNAGNGIVTLTRIAKPADAPTTSAYALMIKTTGTASPYHGGYYQGIQSRANAVFIQKVIAKIPVGYTLCTATNSMGSGYKDSIVGNNLGTGKYATYIRKVECGATGSFSTGGHLYLKDGATPTTSAPLIWYVASSTVYDMTDTEKYDEAIESAKEVADAITERAEQEGWATKLTHIDQNGIFTGQLSANTVTSIRINASQITAGYIDTDRLNTTSLKSILITASNINALTLDVEKGSIGGWTIAASSIRSSNIILDSANKRIAVYKSGSSATSGQRTQIYYSSDSSYGIFSSDSSGNALFTLGSTNRIAGWNITTSALYKNSIYLGSDGSIYNSSNRWRLANDGSGRIANGAIVWNAAGTVTFSSAVSLNWSAPLDALESSVTPKLTKLTSTGIYTGTLTAAQVNAVAISASSITTGTLSADRIASGSIAASKLNASSIKSEIINTSYINGLSCTFVRGTIGGWAIGSDNIMAGTIGADGQMPMQLRTTSIGSGYWYSGAYKPFGISMTWHKSANAGHIVIGQVASSGSTTKSGFMGIQMMSWDHQEYFCLSANYTRIGSKEVYNRIAGWAFDSTAIWKNSVYLGSDGSIYNGSKWRLNNDGSGSIASGNISWNTAGAVTFSSAVSLQWKNDIQAAKSANFGYPYYQTIVINGDEDKYYPVIFKGGDQNHKRDIMIRRSFNEQAPDSWHTATHKGGLVLLLKTNFGGWGGINYSWDIYELSESYCRMFAGALLVGNCCMFAIFLRGGGTTGAKYHIYSDQPIVSTSYSPAPIPAAPQIAYNSELMFQSGSTTVNAPAPRTLTDAVEEEIRTRRFIGLAQASDTTLQEHPLTYIGSTGIYTGTLTAAQVNAVAISATSITTGTLSASRIAAGSIDATKLNADSIKANIINTSYINGLSCTFTRGTIGGWSIESTRLSCGQLVLDDANRRIAVFATGSSSTSGQRTMLYYNSNSDYGFFSTNSSGVTVAQLGSTNRIAGWNLTNSYIYKNSIYLGSDGSIYHSSNRWRLANDGSGRVANGNISWDASGNVTFGSSVELQWKTDINEGQIYVRGTGYNHHANRVVKVNGTTIVENGTRGLQLTVLNRSTLAVISNVIYDVYADESHCNTMATALNALMGDKIVIITSCDAIRINATLNLAIQRCGGNDATFTADRIPYAFVGIPTIGKSNGLTVQFTSASTEPYAEMTTKVVDGIPQGVNTSGKLLTNITGTGIYTGTLTASQITAGTINAARIDVNSIKASILTATNINALTLTTTKGSIGGWNITSSYIYKNSVYLGSDGSIYNGSKWKLANDGSGLLANGNISWDTLGNITARNAIFSNVRIQGSLRNPFVFNDSSIWVGGNSSTQTNFNNYDNIVATNYGSWGVSIPLPWTLENSGRRVTLVNYKWGSNISTGYMDISAPSGKYFYEDGIAKSAISFSRELIELLGYGDDTTFFGWIVVNRQNLMTTSRYGKNLKVLAQGRVTGTSSGASITYKTFDNTTMTVSRVGTGKYKVNYSSTWGLTSSNALFNLTGYGYAVGSSTAPVKASVYGVYSTYFYVNVSDDSSNNDGSFYFQITNMNEWTY